MQNFKGKFLPIPSENCSWETIKALSIKDVSINSDLVLFNENTNHYGFLNIRDFNSNEWTHINVPVGSTGDVLVDFKANNWPKIINEIIKNFNELVKTTRTNFEDVLKSMSEINEKKAKQIVKQYKRK